MGWGKILGTIGAVAGAPFTGGASLAAIPAIHALGGKGGGSDDGGGVDEEDSTQVLDQSRKRLGSVGDSQLKAGTELTDQGLGNLNPVEDQLLRILSGDTEALSRDVQPESDAISQQFEFIRNMVATGPRGGGRTSTIAQLPFEEAKQQSNLMATARRNARTDATGIAGTRINTGLAREDSGVNALGGAANVALGRRGQDVSKRGQNIGLGGDIASTVGEFISLLV